MTNDIGGRLRRAREHRGMSLRDAATRTKLSIAALQAIERMRILRHNVMSFDASCWTGQMVDDAMSNGEMAGFREHPEERWSPAVA